MKATSPTRPRPRRGTAAVVMLVVLLVTELIVIGMVSGGAKDQELSVERLETIQTFYAVEAGMNMAIREMMVGMDEDGDAGIGTVSDDATDANDPTLGVAQVLVTKTINGLQTTLESQGRSGACRRRAEALLD